MKYLNKVHIFDWTLLDRAICIVKKKYYNFFSDQDKLALESWDEHDDDEEEFCQLDGTVNCPYSSLKYKYTGPYLA
jgi:hypothetical protein